MKQSIMRVTLWLIWMALPGNTCFLSEELIGNDDPVVASVEGRLIRRNDVDRLMEELRSRRPWPEAWENQVRSLVLAQLVDRGIVLDFLKRHSYAASDEDVEYALRGLEAELQARGRTLVDYLAQLKMTADQWRDELYWSMSWRRYLDRFMTEENVHKFFERYRRHFDGTRRRVAHIVWQVRTPEELNERLEEAHRVRQQIVSGELSFGQAAARYSQSPTASAGGELGWIERYRPMPESFSRVAFELPVGQVSEPVVTRIGIHLIQCVEEQPGQLTYEDVRDKVQAAMAAYLFRWAADRHRSQVKIFWDEQLVQKPDARIREWLERAIP